MKRQKHYFGLTLIVSILAGIIFPFAMFSKPIDWKWFFYLMVLGCSLVWAIYSLVLLGYVFLIEGRRNRNRPKIREEEDPFPPKLIQEWVGCGCWCLLPYS